MSKPSPCHDSAKSHVAGESMYLEDLPPTRGEVYVGVAVSPVAHGKLVGMDTAVAAAMDGVLGIFTAKDLVHNRWGPIVADQPILAESEVKYIGEPIAIVAAASKSVAAAAARAIKFEIIAETAILSIDAAKTKRAFLQPAMVIQRGDPEAEFSNCPRVLTGDFANKGQDHFYLESQSVIAYPGENGDLLVHSSTQHPSEVQHVVAESLGLDLHQVVCMVKRMGGGFGGKESQASHYAALCALAAHKLRRTARLHLTKDDDMCWTGKRHAFENNYKVGFDDAGCIIALKAELFSDGGAYLDLSAPVLQRAMLHCDNAYYIPHLKVVGQICMTHQPPNTAFRGFGGPQGVVFIENVIEEIAFALGLDPLVVRLRNLYGTSERNVTHYGQTIEQNTLPELFEKIVSRTDYHRRRQEIEAFNQSQGFSLRALSVTPVKFGISFTVKHLNQGNALVNVHRDGTIQVSTGATEMGQGVNVKIAQIVAEVFGLPTTSVKVMPTSTEKNHNTSPTAASSGSDINGFAAQAAAMAIRRRLAAFAAYYLGLRSEDRAAAFMQREDFSLADWSQKINVDQDIIFDARGVYRRGQPEQAVTLSELLNQAYLHRVSMGDYGYYKTPGIYYDRDKGRGHPFLYFTNGVAASEVEIDRYTGDVKVLRTDILMDLGRPINYGIDEGQVVGAFVQGLGWVTTEDFRIAADGVVLTHSPTTYKIPNIQDIPREFNIEFIDNPHNTSNVRGSKAVGEPPLLLAFSVWTAIKQALQTHLKKPVDLRLPATHNEILRLLHGRERYDAVE